jgi:hypothetical protein
MCSVLDYHKKVVRRMPELRVPGATASAAPEHQLVASFCTTVLYHGQQYVLPRKVLKQPPFLKDGAVHIMCDVSTDGSCSYLLWVTDHSDVYMLRADSGEVSTYPNCRGVAPPICKYDAIQCQPCTKCVILSLPLSVSLPLRCQWDTQARPLPDPGTMLHSNGGNSQQ